MRSIRTIVFSWFFISTLTFFTALAIVSYFFAHKLINDFTVRDHQRMIGFLAANIEANLQQHLNSLADLVQHRPFVEFDKVKAESELQSFLGFANLYTSIHLYALDGSLLIASKRSTMKSYTPKLNIRQEFDQSLATLFEEAVQQKKISISDISKARSGLLYQVYAVPVKNAKGEVLRVLMGAFAPEISNLDFLTQGLEFGEHNFISLYSTRAKLMASSASDDLTPVIETLSVQASEHNSTSSEITLLNTREFIVLTKYLPSLRYWIIFGLNRKMIKEKEDIVMHHLFLLFCVCSLFSFGFSRLLGRRISKPFELLVKGFKQLHLGAFEYRIQYDKKDEIGYLCHLFNRFADKIQKDRVLGEFWTNEEELEKIKKGEHL